MGRIAYVNGRFVPHGEASGPHRGPRLPARRRGLRGLGPVRRQAGRRRGPLRAPGAQPGRTAHRHADEPRGADHRPARGRAPQPRARGPGLSAGQRAASARATMPFPTRPVPRQRGDHGLAASTASPPRPRAAKGVTVVTTPENRWGRCDIKTVGLLPNALAKQAAKERRRGRGLVRRRAGLRHRRRLVQRLDHRRRRRAAHPRHQRQHPARRHPPARCWTCCAARPA